MILSLKSDSILLPTERSSYPDQPSTWPASHFITSRRENPIGIERVLDRLCEPLVRIFAARQFVHRLNAQAIGKITGRSQPLEQRVMTLHRPRIFAGNFAVV